MTRSEKKVAIQKVIALYSNETGWANLADVGAPLKKAGLNYVKLKKFLMDFPGMLDFKVEAEFEPPIAFVKVKETF